MGKRTLAWTTGLLFVISAWGLAQNQGKLTARELFYSSGKAPSPPAANAQSGKATKAATPVSQPVVSAANKNATPIAPARPPVEAQAPKTVLVDYTPLGLRYSLLKKASAGQYDEVDVDSIFRSGDGIRVSIESNDNAFLYIVNKGSSGSWNVLFPSSQIENGNNHVQAHKRYEVPAGGQFTFENPPGEERLFIVLAREPEADLEGLIYSLNRRGETPAGGGESKILSVQNINDNLIGKLRNAVLSRDLVFEKVDDQTSARKEKAAYVVNASANLSGRVISDVTLKHR